MPKPRKPSPGPKVTWNTVRELCLSLPGVEESTSYATPALKVEGKLFVRKHQDGESLVVRISDQAKAKRLAEQPDVFYLTDHYVGFPYVLVRMATVRPDTLGEVLEEAWRLVALAAPGSPPRSGRGRKA
jgi:hypothetical protein